MTTTETYNTGLASKDELALYKKMLTVRLLEDELQRLCVIGEASDLHFNKGQEAISVGACFALRKDDYIVTHHRTISHSIAKGIPMPILVAELLGRSTGFNKGFAGEMHIRYPKYRYMFSFQLVGTCMPVAAGLAWAAKYFKKEENIVAVFVGDAASSNAQFHEGLNIAAVRKVPLLVICENNGLAGNIRKEYYLPVSSVVDRGTAYNVKGTKADGNHIKDVVNAVRYGEEMVRKHSFPFIVEFDTTRLCWHKQGQKDARSKEEITELAKRDPLSWSERQLGLTSDAKSKMIGEINQEIQEALAYARRSPWPTLPEVTSQ